MEIIAHRGFWNKESEKNTLTAIKRAIDNGYGFETDYRDNNGTIVISHNMPLGNEPTAEEIFRFYRDSGTESTLALNIKADGLQELLKDMLNTYQIKKYFLFDMSIPDTIDYILDNMNIATRHSEYEKEFPFYSQSSYVWMDCFKSEWISWGNLEEHLKSGKKVCIVSPELHRRPYKEVWNKYASFNHANLMLCTDFPMEADFFFNK